MGVKSCEADVMVTAGFKDLFLSILSEKPLWS